MKTTLAGLFWLGQLALARAPLQMLSLVATQGTPHAFFRFDPKPSLLDGSSQVPVW